MLEQILDFIGKNNKVATSGMIFILILLVSAMFFGYDLTFVVDVIYKILNIK